MADKNSHCRSYLFYLLIAIACTPCASYCPQNLDYGLCSQVYMALEAALLANATNLYQMHEEFFPSSSPEPLYGDIRYTVLVFDSTCHMDMNCNETLFNGTITWSWSSSFILAHIDPRYLNSFQLQVLDLTFSSIGTLELSNSDEGSRRAKYDSLYEPSYVNLELALTAFLNTMDIDFKKYFEAGLEDLTSWLKVYAKTKGSRESAEDYQYKGYSYTYHENTLPTPLQLFLALDILLALLLASVLLRIAPKQFKRLSEKINNSKQWYAFFWACGLTASLMNLTVIIVELSGVFSASSNNHFNRITGALINGNISIYKFTISCVSILLDCAISIAIMTAKPPPFQPPKVLQKLAHIICQMCCCSERIESIILRFLAVWSILSFLHFITLSTLPMLLWFLVLPFRTLLVSSFVIAIVFCVTSFVALLLKSIQPWNETHSLIEKLSILLSLLILLLTLAIVTIGSYLYIKFITSGTQTNTTAGIIVSFFPTATLTIVGWFVTGENSLSKKILGNTDDDIVGTEQGHGFRSSSQIQPQEYSETTEDSEATAETPLL